MTIALSWRLGSEKHVRCSEKELTVSADLSFCPWRGCDNPTAVKRAFRILFKRLKLCWANRLILNRLLVFELLEVADYKVFRPKVEILPLSVCEYWIVCSDHITASRKRNTLFTLWSKRRANVKQTSSKHQPTAHSWSRVI